MKAVAVSRYPIPKVVEDELSKRGITIAHVTQSFEEVKSRTDKCIIIVTKCDYPPSWNQDILRLLVSGREIYHVRLISFAVTNSEELAQRIAKAASDRRIVVRQGDYYEVLEVDEFVKLTLNVKRQPLYLTSSLSIIPVILPEVMFEGYPETIAIKTSAIYYVRKLVDYIPKLFETATNEKCSVVSIGRSKYTDYVYVTVKCGEKNVYYCCDYNYEKKCVVCKAIPWVDPAEVRSLELFKL